MCQPAILRKDKEEALETEGLEVLTEQQCRELLATRDLGRIAFTIDEQPEVFPINYATDGSVVVFRTATGTKLEHSVLQRVAFEVDDWNPTSGVGWSVVVKGVAQVITGALDPFAEALRNRPVVPLAPGAREYWIAVYPSEITGRRFGT